MTTDITELAQRARINAECGEHLSPAETMELVEALESEKRICATWRKTAKSTGEKLEKAQQRIIELVARKEKRLPVPYAYLRESDGQIQISIGAERPSDRSGAMPPHGFPSIPPLASRWRLSDGYRKPEFMPALRR